MLPDIDLVSLAQKVPQIVVVRTSGFLFDCQIQYPAWKPLAAKLQHLVENLGVGGAILLGTSGVSTLNLIKATGWSDVHTTVTDILQHSQIIQGSVLLSKNLINAIKLYFSSRTELYNPIMVNGLLTCIFLDNKAPVITPSTQKGYITQTVDSPTPVQVIQNIEYLTLLHIFARRNSFRPSASLTQLAEDLLKKLLINDNLQALVMYGSRYDLKPLIPLHAADTPIVFSYGQMLARQLRAL